MQERAPSPFLRAGLPGPGAAAALLLGTLAFGVSVGTSTGPVAEAAGGPPVRIVLAPAPAPMPAPTATATAAPRVRPRRHVRSVAPAPAPAPVAPPPPAPVATPSPSPAPTETPTPVPTAADPVQPGVKHVFVVWMAGDITPFATGTYLHDTLMPEATVLERYAGLGAGPERNGIALLSGLGPHGDPGANRSLVDTLGDAGLEARAYQDDACDAPVPRNPLSAFRGECVPVTQLGPDLADPKSTAALTLLTPGDCNAGVPGTCAPGELDGPARADAYLATVVPVIQASPAYAADGLLLVVFDRGPGALAISPFAASGTVSHRAYSPYGLHRTIADIFGVEPLGHAADSDVAPFGRDVWPPQ